jgi:iron complex transport system ATP-binding protein
MRLFALEQYPLPSVNGTPPIRLFGRERWEVLALRSRMGIVSADIHDRFVQGNANGAITALDAVVSGFFATQGVFGHQAVTDAMRDRAAAALERMGVAHLARVPLDRVSTGEARRILIARGLVHEPRALILDEPTRGLDLVSRHAFMERVRRIAADGTTLILVTHYIDEIVPEIGRVILLDRGRIVADGPKRDVLTAERLGPLFGATLAIECHDGYFHARVTGTAAED